MTVDGPFEYHVTSDNDDVTFTNVRFDILGGANFTFNLAVEEFLGTATFTGVTDLVSMMIYASAIIILILIVLSYLHFHLGDKS